MSGKRAKAIRRAESRGMVEEILLTHDFERLDIWTDPNSGEIYFTPKDDEDQVLIVPERAPEPEREYPNDPRPICVNCGKRQNETHYVVSLLGEFFICTDH